MAEPRVISFFVDLDKPIQKETKKELFATGDSNAHEFIGTVKRNGEAVDLSGMGVEATYLSMASGLSTHIDGTISDGKIVVKLSDACYHLAGNARFSIALKKGDFHLTVFSCEMMMTATGSSIVYDPNAVIPSISDLIRKVDELEERVDEVNANIPEDISSVANVIATVNQNSASIAGLQTDVNTAKSDAQAAVSQSNTNATNISAVQNTANDNKADISALSSRVTTAEENISTVNNNLSAANSKLSAVEGKANTNASDISNLKTTVAGHTSNISSIRNDVDSANATAETAEQTAENAKTLVQTLQSAVNTNLETIRETLTDHQEDINTNAGNIAMLNANALMKGGHIAGKWFAADENGTITQVTAPDSAVTPDKIRDALGYTPASVEALNREIDELDAKKVNRTGLPTNKILGSSDVGDLRYFDLDVGVTAQSIEEALGYVPADANNVAVTAQSIKAALGYTPISFENAQVTAEKINDALGYEPADDEMTSLRLAGKVSKTNHPANKYLATNHLGEVVTVDPPSGGGSGGGIPPTGPYQMLVTDGDQNQTWEERTHYPYTGLVEILPEVEYKNIEYEPGTISQNITAYMKGPIVAGKTYYITFGDERLECLAYVDGPGMTVIAENDDFINARVAVIYYSDGKCLLSVNDGDANPNPIVKVEGPGVKYKKLDPAKYLPEGGVGWTEEGGSGVIVETSWEEAMVEQMGGQMFVLTPPSMPLEAGADYTFTINGVEYETTAEAVTIEGATSVCAGNVPAIMETGDNGLPFVYVDASTTPDMVAEGMYGLLILIGGTSWPCTLKIEGGGEVIHGIDPKYLPKGGFGYSEEAVTEKALFEGIITQEEWDTYDGGIFKTEEVPALIEGNTYRVLWPDGYHECKAIMVTLPDAGTFPVIGNTSLLGIGEDTGEPFAIAYVHDVEQIASQGVYTIVFLPVPTTETFPLDYVVFGEEKTEIIHTIDKKYLPSSGGSGMKITITKDESGNYTTDTRLVDVYDMTAAELQAAITVHDGRFEMGVFGMCKYLYGGSVKALVFYMTEASDTELQTTRRMSWLGAEQADMIGRDSNFVEL